MTHLSQACAEAQDRARYAAGAEFRQGADAAVRTAMDRGCRQWPLPREEYDACRTITFNFDSREDHQ